jgi:hypothetical protein
MYGNTCMVLDTLPSMLKGVSQHRLTLPKLTQILPSLALLMHRLEMTLRLVDHLLDMSSCFMACLLTGKPLYFDQLLDLLLRQNFMLSQLLVLNRNTGIASAAISAFSFTLRKLSGVKMLKQCALFKVILTASKQSCDTLISIKCGFAKRLILEESLLNGSLLH